MADYQLAQFNVAKLLAPLESPQLSGFAANLQRVNQLAESSKGFIWRLQDEAGDATALRPLGNEVIVNLSVWENLDTLRAFVYRPGHVELLRQKSDWFSKPELPHLVLWWVRRGHRPDLSEAIEHLELLQREGPGPGAFTFSRPFPEPKKNRLAWLGVYCGSNHGKNPEFTRLAFKLGERIAAEGIGLVYGGGSVGLMGAVADGVLAHRGKVIGVIPQSLVLKEVHHENLTELLRVNTMHERKAIMVERADAFVALPGGFGTFDELFETLTWAQLGIHHKPCAVLNHHHYYDGLLEFIEKSTAAGFVKPVHRDMLLRAHTIDELFRKLRTYTPPTEPKWADP